MNFSAIFVASFASADGMETLGERTLRIVSAFTALKLEYNWQKTPMDAPQLLKLKYIKQNEMESAMEALAQ